MDEYFANCLGSTKIPLAYVIRKELAPQPAPTGGWPTPQQELIGRAKIVLDPTVAKPRYTDVFRADNKLLWTKIAAMTRDKPCWTYVRQHQKQQDARKAYWALYDHYLGPSNVDHMATRAESKLMTTTYTGETKRWNFERYVALHVDQHTILQGLVQYGHTGIDPRSKVRYLIARIKTPTLDTVKTRIMSEASLRNDFDAAAGLYKDFIDQMKSSQTKEVNVAAVGTDLKKKGTPKNDNELDPDEKWAGVKPDMSIDDRFYNQIEYRALTKAQKYGLYLKRNKRTGEQGSKKGKKNKFATKGTKFSKAAIKAIAASVSKRVAFDLKGTEEDSDAASHNSSDSESKEPPTKKPKIVNSNRSNSALKRK
jgi:hypothetical protein